MKKTKIQENSTSNNLVRDLLIANSKILKLNKGKPNNKKELSNRFLKYFELCMREGINPTVEGLAIVSNYDRKSLNAIEHTLYHEEYSDIIKQAKLFIENYDAILATTGEMPYRVYIFRAKNYYGMK